MNETRDYYVDPDYGDRRDAPFDFDRQNLDWGIRAAVFQALGAASVCWEHPDKSGIFDSDRAAEIGEALMAEIESFAERDEPRLGLATTGELLDEVRARVEVDGRLGYRTVEP